ncbi:MAG: PAS domain S-box protein [Candidatus Eremiobacteraeota bacterium]|nr:PAS domain S-box protein [Candidatus Eremiobacteraeota bacterium]
MKNNLHILILEDSISDVELVEREMKRGGLSFTTMRVETEKDFFEGIKVFKPDIILADYTLPGNFDGMSALEISKRSCSDVPFIFVTDTIGEEAAIETLKSGATDYVLKNNLSRLVPAIKRALKDAREQRELKHAEKEKNRLLYDLNERVKELKCLYKISTLVSEPLSLEEIFNKAINLIPSSFRYPDNTCARLLFDGREFKTSNFRETDYKYLADINVYGKKRGTIEVCYAGEKPGPEGKFFLEEEEMLASVFAREIGIIIEKKTAEENFRKRAKIEATLAKISASFIACPDIDSCINDALLEMGKVMDVDRSYLFLLGKDLKVMDNTHEWCAPGVSPQIDNLKNLPVSMVPWWMKKLENNESIVIPEVSGLPEEARAEREILEAQNVQSAIVVPVHISGKPGGFLGFDDTRRTRQWRDDDIQVLRTAADIIGSALTSYMAEENLKISEEKHRNLLENMPDVVFAIDFKGNFTFVSPVVEGMLGYSVEESLKKNVFDLLPNEYHSMVKEKLARRLRGEENLPYELEIFKSDMGRIWVQVLTSPIRDSRGRLIGIQGIARDITARKKAEEELQESYKKLKGMFEQMVTTLAMTLEKRDPYTAGHQQRVADISCAMAEAMGLSDEKIEGIRMAGIIHDLGKIYVPAEILNKPGRLTDLEFGIIKTHPRAGYEIVKPVKFPWPVADVILQHHERVNGSGYPGGLNGDEILQEAKIIAVADVVEAMVSHRPYRPALSIEEALKEILEKRGILYDPDAVDACILVFAEKGFRLT